MKIQDSYLFNNLLVSCFLAVIALTIKKTKKSFLGFYFLGSSVYILLLENYDIPNYFQQTVIFCSFLLHQQELFNTQLILWMIYIILQLTAIICDQQLIVCLIVSFSSSLYYGYFMIKLINGNFSKEDFNFEKLQYALKTVIYTLNIFYWNPYCQGLEILLIGTNVLLKSVKIMFE
eukprot:NODE_104_length_19294_cov_0.449179.p16 type:complete len:176 gc:universal NODE_104_length_19294_cov_0.449179:11296-10769(-)